jgi:hypothetical protein
MGMRRRQEVLNVVLADLLQERGVVAAPETIIKSGPEKSRHMPDVIVNFQGLRTAIEGEVEGPNARQKALASASRRVETGIAHIGIAVVYPEQLRSVKFSKLKSELAHAELAIAITNEAGIVDYMTGDVAYLERALRGTFGHLIREDVVAEAVDLLDEAVGRFADTILNHKGVWGRVIKSLGTSISDRELSQLSDEQVVANCHIAGLVLINAIIFHQMLSEHYSEITPLGSILASQDYDVFVSQWQYVLDEINYYPIFHLSREILLSLSRSAFGVIEDLNFMVEAASQITQRRAALRHDLMGRVYHRLLAEAKYLGTYYTSIPAATILLKLALKSEYWPIAWEDLEQVGQLRIADLACGTGTLLVAAGEAVVDNYISMSVATGEDVELGPLHAQLAETVLYGYDVLPSAIHLTASTLALRNPDTPFDKMNLFSLPLGGEFRRLGSIEFLRGHSVQMPLDLFGASPQTQQMTGQAIEEHDAAPLPNLDLCVMNPPFVRSVGGNLLFGSLPEVQRSGMQRELKKLVKSSGAKASITAGLGSVFVAIADRYLKPGGRLALVLPKTLLSGVAWGQTRELINSKYHLEYVIVSHDAERWNFSESTNLSEVLLVATKNTRPAYKAPPDHKVTVVNLWRNPTMALEALAIASSIEKATPTDLEDSQGSTSISMNSHKTGEVLTFSWDEMQTDWFLPCAFAQTALIRSTHNIMKGSLRIPGIAESFHLGLCPLDKLGTIGPDRRDIYDGFSTTTSPTPYPAFWGHDASLVVTLAQAPNVFLAPLSQPAKGRNHLRSVSDLWPLSGRIIMAEGLRLNTQRLSACLVSEPVLANVWWPFAIREEFDQEQMEQIRKSIVLWLNSTLGLLILYAHRTETEGAWIGFKKPTLLQMPVLDVRKLSLLQLSGLADTYDRLSSKHLQPFPHMATDEVRTEMDLAISQALGLPDIATLRTMLGREPVVSMERL